VDYIVQASFGSDGHNWLSAPDRAGIRSFGPKSEAERFPNRIDAINALLIVMMGVRFDGVSFSVHQISSSALSGLPGLE
jgi:hypothetical protein